MKVLKIKGGLALKGSVKASGAKNSTTKLLVASLLSDKKCTFYNVPNIGDVEVTVDLCREIGSEIVWDKESGKIEICTKQLKSTNVPQRFSGSNRIPILLIGALLGRTDQTVMVPLPGGCNIGSRPIDFHIAALEKLGAKIEFHTTGSECAYFASAPKGLKGAVIHLPSPSVGATENSILAASRSKGLTVIKNAAIEPEIIDIVLFLQKLGVCITVEVDRTILIQGSHEFYDVEHTIITDRIEAASLGMAAISTKGRVMVEGAQHLHMITFLNYLRELGAGFDVKQGGIEFYYKGPLRGGLHIETGVYPGFSTDWQQPMVALLTQAKGHSVVHETVYENRFGYTEMLKTMGADVQLFTHCLGSVPCRFASENYHHSLVVKGITPLESQNICIPDLRAGFAYVMAALIAPGSSTISGIHYLDRGYEKIVEKLTSVGAEIARE